jgi:hypothetical protein
MVVYSSIDNANKIIQEQIKSHVGFNQGGIR